MRRALSCMKTICIQASLHAQIKKNTLLSTWMLVSYFSVAMRWSETVDSACSLPRIVQPDWLKFEQRQNRNIHVYDRTSEAHMLILRHVGWQ